MANQLILTSFSKDELRDEFSELMREVVKE